MRLPQTEKDLDALLNYLALTNIVEPHFSAVVLHSIRQDRDHDKDPRAFCHFCENDNTIYCSSALEHVSPPVRMGILLHEVGHLYLNAFDDPDVEDGEEVDVDDWAVHTPNAGYTYTDEWHTWRGKRVLARNVETVGPAFVETVYEVYRE